MGCRVIVKLADRNKAKRIFLQQSLCFLSCFFSLQSLTQAVLSTHQIHYSRVYSLLVLSLAFLRDLKLSQFQMTSANFEKNLRSVF